MSAVESHLDPAQGIPEPDRPEMPKDYGVPDHKEGMLPWSFIDDRMQKALNYWVATVRPGGRPHATPVWGVWLDGRFFFEGSPETRRGRNIAANPAVVVHLENGSEVVILEGLAQEIENPDKELGIRLAQSFGSKYAQLGYTPQPDQWDRGGLYTLQLLVVLAWSKFPTDATRWVFSNQ